MYEFTFNWGSWPFVIVDEELEEKLMSQIDVELRRDLVSWCDFMQANFNEERGFSSDEAEDWANSEYENLALRLRSKGLTITTDNWWS
jgi:proline racemase